MRFKILTAVYVLVLAAIIYMADRKEYEAVFNHIKAIPFHDKLGHFFLMGLLSFVVALSFPGSRVRLWGFNILKSSLVVAGLVTLEEFSQLFIAFRSFSLADLFFDYLGIILFGQLAYYLKTRKAVAPDQSL
ncbi:MAG: VanZ family protein [Blastocatellia bacterium]|nr:VanZ family protein [Blastocatellia bacterium]